MTSTLEYDRAAERMRTTARGGLVELVRLATLAASSHNTQPWLFRITPDAITVLPDYRRRCPVVDPDDAHLFKSLGCAAENLLVAAAAQGLCATADFDSGREEIRIGLERGGGSSDSATPLARAIEKRQCTRAAYDGKPVALKELRLLEQAGAGAGVRTQLLTSRPQLEQVTELVRSGNAAQLANAAFRRELIEWIRFNPASALRTGDGLAGRTSGQPPLPDWLASRLARWVITAKSQNEVDTRNLRSSPGVAVFVANANSKAAWVETGRCYERFALQATALGIRNAFVNQPVEVSVLRPQLHAWLGLGCGEHVLLLARFGYGRELPYSLRRPVADVLAA